MTVVVATTLCAFTMDDPNTWGAWLHNAEAMAAASDVRFFAAIEVDARGLEPFAPFLDRLAELGGEYWAYCLDDSRTEVTTANRLRHITAGQNLCADHCTSPGVDWMLFLAADCEPPPDTIRKLLEVQWPIVGAEVPTYCLNGPIVDRHPETGQQYGFPVAQHMATAAFIFLHRSIYTRLRWRWDATTGESDDPCYHRDARELLGRETLVRKDVIGRHYPESIGPVEGRGHNMEVVR